MFLYLMLNARMTATSTTLIAVHAMSIGADENSKSTVGDPRLVATSTTDVTAMTAAARYTITFRAWSLRATRSNTAATRGNTMRNPSISMQIPPLPLALPETS